MTSKYEYTITHEGWVIFCPCWFTGEDYNLMPIPKYKLGFLLDFCYWLQGICFTLCSFLGIECRFVVKMRELENPFVMELEQSFLSRTL